jgi:glycosyltransferase involved in cell wall biosynthesis
MNIAISDCTRFKFSKELMKHWADLGHTVKYSMYWNPEHVEWADIVFFDWVDNSLIRASNPNDEFYKDGRFKPLPKGKHIITRCHDIDAWMKHYKSVDWTWVDDLIFVADHIRDMVLNDLDLPTNVKVHTIKHGIDLNKYTFREKPKGNKIAWIGRIVGHKGLELALQVLAENPEYELHVVGSSLDSWEFAYVDDFVTRNKLKFFHQAEVQDINVFLEDKDFILLTSFKEAFSYVSAEAMAKGIKPLIHHFWGAETVWDKKYLWEKVSDVKSMLEGSYEPEVYRRYIKDNYSLERMLKNYDEVFFKQ